MSCNYTILSRFICKKDQTHHHQNIVKVLLHKIVINSWKSWLDVIDIYHWCLYHNLVDSILSESSIRKWDHWHLIWQNKKSSRGTFGLWGNILSGSLRLLPKHLLPTPVPEPLDKKYQVWIWGSALLWCYSLRYANKKIQMPEIMEADNKYFTRYHLLTSPMAGWASQQDKGCWQSYVWNLPHWYFKS